MKAAVSGLPEQPRVDVEVQVRDGQDFEPVTLAEFRQLVHGRVERTPSDQIAEAGRDLARIGLEQLVLEFEQKHDVYHAILAKALADRLAEAFAEYLHRHIRTKVWGYDSGETLDNSELIKELYRGIRPAPGYPANPDHRQKLALWILLGVEAAAGISLTESLAMWPAASVSGWYFSHPESKYFAVGKLAKDQVVDYARRELVTVDAAERILAPSLGFVPCTDNKLQVA